MFRVDIALNNWFQYRPESHLDEASNLSPTESRYSCKLKTQPTLT